MFATRIVIADADQYYRKELRDTLVHAGYIVTGIVGDGRGALKAIFQTEPDLVIMDTNLPGGEGLDILSIIKEHRAAPVILLGTTHELEVLERARDSWIFAYLIKPVSETQLFPAIEIAVVNFNKFMTLEEENRNLKKALEERKLVEKAKGLVMETTGLSENEAYKYLQKLSMNKCVPIARVAREVIGSLAAKKNKGNK